MHAKYCPRIASIFGALIASFLLFACASKPVDLVRSEPPLPTRNAPTQLQKIAAAKLAANPSQNAFHPMQNGKEAMLMRLVLARTAEQSLDLQYYIWQNDFTGRYLAKAILDAADRGVRVRVLVDDLGTAGDLDDTLLNISAHPNIAVRIFNPLSIRSARGYSLLSDFSRTNHRMHNKAMIADGQIAILGGRNIGDEYFGAATDVTFTDLDVVTSGPILPQVNSFFETFWNAEAVVSIESVMGEKGDSAGLKAVQSTLARFVEAQKNSPYTLDLIDTMSKKLAAQGQDIYWGKAELLHDSPDKVKNDPSQRDKFLIKQVGARLPQAKKDLLIVSPYFIPGDAGVAWFKAYRERGVRVRILTNSLAASDVEAVHSGYQRYREALLAAGVELYELRPSPASKNQSQHSWLGGSRSALHAKTFIVDHQTIFIGSLNLDPRSVEINTEDGLICDSPDMTAMLAAQLDKGLVSDAVWRLTLAPDQNGDQQIVWIEQGPDGEVRHTQEPEVSVGKRFGVWIYSLFPIESQI